MRKIIAILGVIASACFLNSCTTTTQTRVYSASVSPYGYYTYSQGYYGPSRGYYGPLTNNNYGYYSYYGAYYPPADFYYPYYAISGPFPYTSLTAYRRYDPYYFDPYSYGYGSYRTWAGYYPSW